MPGHYGPESSLCRPCSSRTDPGMLREAESRVEIDAQPSRGLNVEGNLMASYRYRYLSPDWVSGFLLTVHSNPVFYYSSVGLILSKPVLSDTSLSTFQAARIVVDFKTVAYSLLQPTRPAITHS